MIITPPSKRQYKRFIEKAKEQIRTSKTPQERKLFKELMDAVEKGKRRHEQQHGPLK